MLAHPMVLGTVMKHGDKVLVWELSTTTRMSKQEELAVGAHNMQLTFVHEKNHQKIAKDAAFVWRKSVGLEVAAGVAGQPKFPADFYPLDQKYYALDQFDEEMFARASGAVPGSPYVKQLYWCVVLIEGMPYGTNLIEWYKDGGKLKPRLVRGTSQKPPPVTQGIVPPIYLGKVPNIAGDTLKNKDAYMLAVPLVDSDGKPTANLKIAEFAFKYAGISITPPEMKNDYSAGGGVWRSLPLPLP